MATSVFIFVLTYVMISARRMGWLGLERPAGALLGALLCVLLGVVDGSQAISAVDGHTLLLLFAMMGMGSFLMTEGGGEWIARALVRFSRTGTGLLGGIIWFCGPLSALITNDAVCILAAPLVVQIIRRYELPPLPFLLALATASNTGSVATLVGNPQNMLCANLGGLQYLDYLLVMGPVGLIGLLINHGVLWILFRKTLNRPLLSGADEGPSAGPPRKTVWVLLGTAVVFAMGGDLAWTALGGLLLMMMLQRRPNHQVWSGIDGSILLFFVGLFVVVEGLVQSGAVAWLFLRFPLWQAEGALAWVRLSSIFLVGSNIVSNVPFILVVSDELARLPHPTTAWTMLAMASTFAGNLTLLGSVANIIVAESARDLGGIFFFAYLRVGLPIALLTTAMGTLWLLFTGTWHWMLVG